ncbi:spore germination protein [Clostridium arbusti]|uniref:spore germination protein n=1 Tax=Clostridium arbusti TaxID=1137848 RepID=UPI0002886EF9|nr:spore germination protein [Clostridium arbusti]
MGTNMDEFYDKSAVPPDDIDKVFSTNEEYIENQALSGNLASDVQELKTIFNKSSDIVYRKFQFASTRKGILIFIDGFVDIKLIDSDVLRPLIDYRQKELQNKNIFVGEILNLLQNRVITASNIKLYTNIQDVVDNVVKGNTVLLIDGIQQAISIDVKKFDKRNVEEPQVESVVRGPREGFTENLRTNIILVRRRLKTSKLKIESMKLGRLSQTDIAVMYIDGIVKDSLVTEILNRMSKIDIDTIVESITIEEIIEDNHFSIFSQFGITERPDRLAANLSEGHVGIIIDNTPMALMAPHTFIDMMKSSEDYYDRYFTSCLITWIRYLFLILSVFLPSFYIALLTFHQGMIPRPLLLTIASSREGVPFPIFIESLLMQIFFEGLQEASIRLPRVTGQTVSIIGGLVIGQAAIQAGIVSAATVIVIAITGVASFTMPRQNLVAAIRITRFPMIILGGTLGLYGIFIGAFFTLIHMEKLRSFGIPFLTSISPLSLSDLKDTFIRAPWWAMISRPDFIETKNSNRMKKTASNRSSKSK